MSPLPPVIVALPLLGIIGVFLGATLSPDPPFDDSDPRGGRSGMGVHTDCLTGLQYLSGSRGGLTPRLNQEGNQILNQEGC